MSAFDPNSNDAMFAKVLSKLDEHGDALKQISSKIEGVNSRQMATENELSNAKGKIAVFSMFIAAGVSAIAEIGISLFKRHAP